MAAMGVWPFRSICPLNLLSFGPATEPLELKPLNVLIGPNGSGKSNLLEVFSLLRACPERDGLRRAISRGGGIGEWVWKGDPKKAVSIEAIVDRNEGLPLRHDLDLRSDELRVQHELIANVEPAEDRSIASPVYSFNVGFPALVTIAGAIHTLKEAVAFDASILAQRQDPESYPEFDRLASVYRQVTLYREWSLGRNTVFREPQRADLRTDRLEEDFSNLAMFLNRLRRHVPTKKAILDRLADLYEGFTDFDVKVEGGTVQVFFTEGDFSIPATRLSDGTLRYLCLLAILLDPKPPAFIGIEEPELGLHPDLIPKVADLLVAASARTQLVVTTHSDILIDALTEHPESIVICEKHEGQTTMRRLERDALAEWLKNYRLGELWTKGQLGGTRW